MPLSSLSKKYLPREKILAIGANHASIEELCSVIIGSGTQKESAFEMGARVARYVLTNTRSKHDFSQMNIPTFIQARFLAAIELGRRIQQKIQEPIVSPLLAVQRASELIHSRKEIMIGLYLDSRSLILHKEVLAIGGLNQASLHPRDLFLPLRDYPACNGLLLLHNHPSGNPDPSPEDLHFTKRVREACQLVGLRLEDHIVVAKESWVSFRERGLL